MSTSTLRERRLFRDSGRALVIAMDHARAFNTVTDLKDANAIIETVIAAGADAILAPMGTASGCGDALGNGGLWLRGDISAFRAGATPKILVPLMLALCHDCAVVRPGVFR